MFNLDQKFGLMAKLSLSLVLVRALADLTL
jgi:hypothetical protein